MMARMKHVGTLIKAYLNLLQLNTLKNRVLMHLNTWDKGDSAHVKLSSTLMVQNFNDLKEMTQIMNKCLFFPHQQIFKL